MNGKVILFLSLASCAFAAFVPSSEDVEESFLDFLAQDVIPTVKVDTIPTVRTDEVSFNVDESNQEELKTEDDGYNTMESNGFQCLLAHSICYSSEECCSKRCCGRVHRCMK